MKKKVFLALLMFTVILSFYKVNATELKNEDIPVDTYIIGSHMLRHRNYIESDNYKGQLTTKIIMFASTTIFSDDIDDMIIYYKNPLGEWWDGETGEEIQVPEKFDIEYTDLESTAPTLLTEYGTPSLRDRETYNFDGEKYIIDFADGNPDKCRMVNNNSICDMEYGELYEVNPNTNEYTMIMDNFSIIGWNKVRQNAGTIKYYALRGYIVDGEGNKIYTPYSSVYAVDLTDAEAIPTPNIAFFNEIKYENGYNKYEVVITNTSQYSNHAYNYIVYTKNSDDVVGRWPDVTEVPDSGNTGKGIDESTYVNIDIGETNKLVASVYYEISGKRFYSALSDDALVETASPAVPTLSPGMGGYGYAKFTIVADGKYASETMMNKIENGYFHPELYIKEGNEYTVVDNWTVTKNGTYVARVYVTNSQNEKVFSEYSNELVFDEELPAPVPVLAEFGYDDVSGKYHIGVAGDYSVHHHIDENCPYSENDDNYGTCITDTVDSYEWYIKDGNNYTLFEDNSFGVATTLVPDNEITRIVARAYVQVGEDKIFSPYSDELVIDLANPQYTFKLLDKNSLPELSNLGDDKYVLRFYFNNYEINIGSIVIDGNTYSEYFDTGSGNPMFAIDKTTIENVNTISLKLSDSKLVTATRKN